MIYVVAGNELGDKASNMEVENTKRRCFDEKIQRSLSVPPIPTSCMARERGFHAQAITCGMKGYSHACYGGLTQHLWVRPLWFSTLQETHNKSPGWWEAWGQGTTDYVFGLTS